MVVPPAEEDAGGSDLVQEQEKPTKEGFFACLKRGLLKTKKISVPDLSVCSAAKSTINLFEELEEQLLIADVGVETTRKIIANLTEGASRKTAKRCRGAVWSVEDEMGEILGGQST